MIRRSRTHGTLRAGLGVILGVCLMVNVVPQAEAEEPTPTPLSPEQIVAEAERIAEESRAPTQPVDSAQPLAPSPSGEPEAPPPAMPGEVAAGKGGSVTNGPVRATFSGDGLTADLQVAVTLTPQSPSAGRQRSVGVPGAGLPANAVVLTDPFEVTALREDGTPVTEFPTAFEVVRGADGVERAENIVPGVELDVAVDAARLAGIDPGSVGLWTRESATEPWVEVASYLDVETAAVHGELDHLSQFVVIGTPFTATPGPVVVLDPDNDIGYAEWGGKRVTELAYNYALSRGVAARLVEFCEATVVITRTDATDVVEHETRAKRAKAAGPDLTMTLAFNASVGHPWGDEDSGGGQIYRAAGFRPLATAVAKGIRDFTGRSAAVTTSDRLPHEPFLDLPGGVVHSETLYLDHNFDWPVINKGMDSIADGVFTGAATWLESQGFDCTDRATTGWPKPPSKDVLAKWRKLGRANHEAYGADPVGMATGNLVEQFPLASVSGLGDQTIDLGLTYNAQDGRESRLGWSWTWSLGGRAQRFDDGSVLVVRGDGASLLFSADGKGGYIGEPGTGTLSEAGQGVLAWTDPDQSVWRFDASNDEGIGELVSVTDPDGHVLRLAYAKAGPDAGFRPLASVTDAAGQQVNFGSDPRGRITSLTLPDGRRWTLDYDAAGDLASITDPAERRRSFTYDGKHRLLTATDPTGARYLVNGYDGQDRIVSQQDAAGNQRWFEYTTDGALNLTRYTDGLGRVHQYWSDAAGRIVRTVDPAGGEQVFVRNAAGDPTSFTDETGRITRYTYDPAGNLTMVDGPDGVFEYTYDTGRNLTSLTGPSGSGGRRSTRYALTAAGLVAAVTDAAGGVTQQDYNAGGDIVSTTSPAGATSRFGYDDRGNLTSTTDAAGRVTSYTYDAGNRPTSVTDPAGSVTRFTWNALDKLTSRTDPDGTVTRYSYDGNGNLLSLTAADGGETTYTWDGDFHPLTVTDPLGRVTRYGWDAEDQLTSVTAPDGTVVRRSFDPAGRLVATTDPRGGVASSSYDPAGRLLTQTSPGGAITRYTRDDAGRVTGLTDAAGATWGYGYDDAGRLVAEVDPLGNFTRYGYDVLDRLVAVTDPAGEVETYAYDADGNTTAVTDRRGAVTRYTYDPTGQPVTETGADGTVWRYGLDPAGRTDAVTNPLGDTIRWTYDPLGQVTAVTDPLGNTNRWQYDAMGRVTAAIDAAGARWASTYDTAGQLQGETSPTGGTTAYTWDAAGQVTSVVAPSGVPTSYGYDENGNLVRVVENPGGRPGSRLLTQPSPDSDVTWVYTWDADDQLTTITDPLGRVTSYDYDKAGRQTGRTVPGGGRWTSTWDAAGRLATATDPSGRTTSYTVDPRGDITGLRYADGTTVDFRYDADQNVIAMTDPTGATGWTYDPSGRASTQTDTTGRVLSWAYDKAGQLASTRLVDAAGGQLLETAWSLDAAGRPTTQVTTVPAGTYTAGYSWNPTGRIAGLSRTNPDQSPAATTSWAYDEDGNPTAISHLTPTAETPAVPAPLSPPAKNPGASGRCVTAASYLAARTLPATPAVASDGTGIRLDYTWDAGRVTAMTRTTGKVPAATKAFDPGPALTAATGLDHTASLLAPSPTTRPGKSRPAKAAPAVAVRTGYGYDALGRVTGAEDSTGVVERFGWNAAGDRTSWSTTDDPRTPAASDRLAVTWAYGDNGLPATAHLTGTGGTTDLSYSWDANGNRTSVTAAGSPRFTNQWNQTTTWTSANQLATLTTPDTTQTYAYDGLGRQTTTTTTPNRQTTTTPDRKPTTTNTTFDGLTPLAATTDRPTSPTFNAHRNQAVPTQPTDTEVWIQDGLGQTLLETATALQATTDGETRWQLVDALGSVIAQNPTTTITQASDWSTFGIQQPTTTGWASTPGYTGQPTNPTTTTTTFPARTYDPTTATWLTPDTWPGTLTTPQTQNPHTYVLGNPVTLTDPDGHAPMIRTFAADTGHQQYTPTTARNPSLLPRPAPRPRSAPTPKPMPSPSPQAPPRPPTAEDVRHSQAMLKRMLSDLGHIGMDLLGFVPVAGNYADGANAVWYGREGNLEDAGLSAAGAIPFAGIATTIGKWFKGIYKTIEAATKTTKTVKKATKAVVEVRPPLAIGSQQFGAKWGKHASDYGLDPSSEAARGWFQGRAREVHLNPDEVRKGAWNPNGGGGKNYFFFRQGDDLLITKPDGEFVTMFPGGSSNGWFKSAEVFPR